ncbi:MAG: hypothetical protein JXK16_02930 [Thiotrichales bacterium]|nr:hypothetical protein [Thiotrichales bacterium]
MAKRLHWRTSLLFGLMSFIVLYFVAPWFLLETVSQTQGKVLQPVIDLNFNRISWLFEKLGIAALVIFWFFAAINFWKGRP